MAEFTDFLKSAYNGHIGKMCLDKMQSNGKLTHQIDIVSGIEETNESVRSRTIQLAQVFKARNLKLGDVIMVCAMNHKDAGIPLLSSMCLGLIPVHLAIGMTHAEFKHVIALSQPKIIFTDPGMVDDIHNVLTELKDDAEIVVFGSVKDRKYISYDEFSKSSGNIEEFKCEEFDPETTTAFAVCSSGTTGLPKLVALTHRTAMILILLPYIRMPRPEIVDQNYPYGKYLTFSPLIWVSGLYSIFMSALIGIVRIQSNEPFSVKLACDAIEKYKPNIMMLTPMGMYDITKDPNIKDRDLSSLKISCAGGSAVSQEVAINFQKLTPNGIVAVAYGSTEAGSISVNIGFVKGSVGKFNPWLQWKLVDPETEKVLGPNQVGELRVKSIMMFQKYYNDPESTVNAFDSENYYKTGDLLYYDEEGYFFFVDRCKEMIKYRNYQVATTELENKISNLPEVLSSCVVGLPDPANGELPMAFVQLVLGSTITAQRIKDVIKESFSDYKQLRGGVVFVDKLPLTHSGKINRKAVNALKLTMKGE